MNKNYLSTAIAALILSLASTAQAQASVTVGAWGNNGSGQTDVPVAAESGVTSIAAGDAHTVALKIDGTVVAWGGNWAGQTTVPTGLSGVTAIAAGRAHTLALKNDGSMVAWGDTNVGQTTVPVAAQSGVTGIAAGNDHTVALKIDGTLVAWGYNYHGQVTGTPTPADPYSVFASPITLGDQVLDGVIAIAAGGAHTVALKSDGTVVVWGFNGCGQTNVPAGLSSVTAIAAGECHTVALKNDGSVVTWGSLTMVPIAAQSGVTAIAARGYHTVALKNDGTVVAWGSGQYGESTVPLGLGSVTAIAAGDYHTVVLVIPTAPTITMQPVGLTVNEWQRASFNATATGFPLKYQWRKDDVNLIGEMTPTYGLRFAQINQAGSYTVVVSNHAGSVTSAPPAVLKVDPAAPGAVVAWGENSSGQTDVPLAAQSGVTAIAAGGNYTVALKIDGSVLAWGHNYWGQTTVPVAAQTGVTSIAAGDAHTVALRIDGTVVAWGANLTGQVTGTPTITDPYSAIASPVTLGGQVLSGVTAIAAGGNHTVALKIDGTVIAWGANEYGQVTGTPTIDEPRSEIASPVTLEGQILSGVTAIAAGGSYYGGHTLALKNDGSVVAWGNNGYGQTTVPITAQSGVTAIAAGYLHTVALKHDGSVVTWGYYSEDQANVPVAARSGVIAIAGGDGYTLALKNDGSVVVWGYGGSGLPDVPVGLSGVTAIAARLSHSVVLLGTAPLLPFLDARPGGNELILSWSTNTAGFALQSTPHLTPPAPWIDVTNVPALLGAQWTVTNIFSGSAQFYRLRKQSSAPVKIWR